MTKKELLKTVLHARSVIGKNDAVLNNVKAWLTIKAVICVMLGRYQFGSDWEYPSKGGMNTEMVATWDFNHEYLGNQTWQELSVAKGWNNWYCWIYSNGT